MAAARSAPPPCFLVHTPIVVVVPAQVHSRPFFTMLTGPQPGRVYPLGAAGAIIGRGDDSHIVVDDPAVSRHHASVGALANGRFWLTDLGSTNGTFVGSSRITECALQTGDRVHIGPNVSFRFGLADQLEFELQRRLYESSTFDALTGVLNRGSIFRQLETELDLARERRAPLSVLMIDVDHFKQINDTEGHAAGDEVLRRLGRVLAGAVRGADLVGRYGGEEFVVVGRGTRLDDATGVAERLRLSIQQELCPTTVSIGVASTTELATPRPEALMMLADQRVYLAKSAGRNRVVSSS